MLSHLTDVKFDGSPGLGLLLATIGFRLPELSFVLLHKLVLHPHSSTALLLSDFFSLAFSSRVISTLQESFAALDSLGISILLCTS